MEKVHFPLLPLFSGFFIRDSFKGVGNSCMNEIVVKSSAYGGLFFYIHLITSRHNPMF